MKVLVSAASKYEATSEIAQAIADVLASATRVQEGDFRNWDDIRAWATSIADTLIAA